MNFGNARCLDLTGRRVHATGKVTGENGEGPFLTSQELTEPIVVKVKDWLNRLLPGSMYINFQQYELLP